jgi:hypothetical protein
MSQNTTAAAHLCKLCSLLVDLLICQLLRNTAVGKLWVWVELAVPAWGATSNLLSGTVLSAGGFATAVQNHTSSHLPLNLIINGTGILSSDATPLLAALTLHPVGSGAQLCLLHAADVMSSGNNWEVPLQLVSSLKPTCCRVLMVLVKA